MVVLSRGCPGEGAGVHAADPAADAAAVVDARGPTAGLPRHHRRQAGYPMGSAISGVGEEEATLLGECVGDGVGGEKTGERERALNMGCGNSIFVERVIVVVVVNQLYLSSRIRTEWSV